MYLTGGGGNKSVEIWVIIMLVEKLANVHSPRSTGHSSEPLTVHYRLLFLTPFDSLCN
jgi:hypothetical protein